MNNANVALVGGSLTIIVSLSALGTAQSMEYVVAAGFAAVMGGFVLFMGMMIGER